MKIQVLITGTYSDGSTFSGSYDNVDAAISGLEDIQYQEDAITDQEDFDPFDDKPITPSV